MKIQKTIVSRIALVNGVELLNSIVLMFVMGQIMLIIVMSVMMIPRMIV